MDPFSINSSNGSILIDSRGNHKIGQSSSSHSGYHNSDSASRATSSSSSSSSSTLGESSMSSSNAIYDEYNLEALPKPYQTMVEALFILTAIVAFVFNCLALWLIFSKFGRRTKTTSSSSSRSGRSFQAPKELLAEIRANGKICEVLNTDTNHLNTPPTASVAASSNVQTTGHHVQHSISNYHYCSKQQHSVKLRSSSSQLNIYLVNLFINDLVIALLNVPFTYTDFMYGQWIYWAWLCPTINFISTCAVSVSIYTLIAIGFERYFAIICPFKKLVPFERHTKYIIGLIWTIGVFLAIPMLIQSRAIPFNYRNETLLDCRELWEQEIGGKVYTGVLFIATFLLPFFLLTFLYVSIAVKTFRHVIPGNADASRDQIQLRNKIRMIKMLVLLVITFAVCWLPLQTFNMVMWLCDRCRSGFSSPPSLYNSYVALTFACHWFSIAHAMLDPIIYCFSSRNFKIRELLFEIRSYGKRMLCCGGDRNDASRFVGGQISEQSHLHPYESPLVLSTQQKNSDSLRRVSATSNSVPHRNSTTSKISVGRTSFDSTISTGKRSSHSSIQRFTFDPISNLHHPNTDLHHLAEKCQQSQYHQRDQCGKLPSEFKTQTERRVSLLGSTQTDISNEHRVLNTSADAAT